MKTVAEFVPPSREIGSPQTEGFTAATIPPIHLNTNPGGNRLFQGVNSASERFVFIISKSG